MNRSISKILVTATLIGATGVVAASVRAEPVVRSKAIVVESPSDLPELAQGRGEAMYLHRTADGKAILYIEREQGRTLAFLDVSDPASIKAIGQVSLDAPAPYDFVQDLAESAVLIHYRNHSGFAVIGFKNYRQPVLKSEPAYLHPPEPSACALAGCRYAGSVFLLNDQGLTVVRCLGAEEEHKTEQWQKEHPG